MATRGLARPRNMAITTADHPTPALRPSNSRLSSTRFASVFGITLPGFQEALPTVLDEALQQGAPKETESTAS
jgi:dTDP-4-dehydrorhamnose reductase